MEDSQPTQGQRNAKLSAILALTAVVVWLGAVGINNYLLSGVQARLSFIFVSLLVVVGAGAGSVVFGIRALAARREQPEAMPWLGVAGAVYGVAVIAAVAVHLLR